MGRPRKTERNNDLLRWRELYPNATLKQLARWAWVRHGGKAPIRKQRVSKIIKDYGTPELTVIDYANIPERRLNRLRAWLGQFFDGMLEGLK